MKQFIKAWVLVLFHFQPEKESYIRRLYLNQNTHYFPYIKTMKRRLKKKGKSQRNFRGNLLALDFKIPKSCSQVRSKAESSSNNQQQNQEHHETMFAGTEIPPIPPLPHEMELILNKFRTPEFESKTRRDKIISNGLFSDIDTVKGATNRGITKQNRTKLNGFMAFRSYHTRNISTENQGVLSAELSKVWSSDVPSQMIWKRYATEYNAFTSSNRDIPFIHWLIQKFPDKSASKSQAPGISLVQPLKMQASRIEDIFMSPPVDYLGQMADGGANRDQQKNRYLSYTELRAPYIDPNLHS